MMLLASSALASGPKNRFEDPLINDELINIYKDLKNPTINFGTASSFTVTSLTVSSMTVSSFTVVNGTVKTKLTVPNGVASTDAAAFGQIGASILKQAPVVTYTATAFTTTSNALQTTNCTATITPTSASSRILVFAQGTAKDNSASITEVLTLARGTTDLTADGGLQTYSANSVTPASLFYVDSPATTSATTYNVRIRNSDNVTTVGFGTGFGQVMILMEVQ